MLTMDFLILLLFLFTQNANEASGQLDSSKERGGGLGAYGINDRNLLTLTPSTPSITHFVNESFIIFCKTVQKGIGTKWRDPNGHTRENTKGRVHIEEKSDFLALVFEHISLSDMGNWTCEVNEAYDARKSFELLVNQKISFGKTEHVQSVREGRDATVYCFVKGEPIPDVSWLYNGEYINTVNSSKHKRLSDGLFIKNVSQVDAGEYTCRAIRITPTFSDSDQITILLRIQHKPRWFFNDTIPIHYAYIGGTVNLSCEAIGEPPPRFTWLHNGKPIVGFNHEVLYTDFGSILQLHVKHEKQLGDYKCKVSNPLGMIERTIKLHSGPKPHSPTYFEMKRWYTDAFELDIRTQKLTYASDEMQVYAYRIEYISEHDFKFSGGNWSYANQRDFSFHRGHRFFISNLSCNTTYLMRAASRNLAGFSDWSQVKTFATLASYAGSTFQHFSQPQLWLGLILIVFYISSP